MSEQLVQVDPAIVRRDALRSLVRAAVATARMKLQGNGNALDYARGVWPHDQRAQLLLRGATAPTSTIEAAALQTVALAFLESLKPLTAASFLLNECLTLSFGDEGSIAVPTFAPGQAGFVGEGLPIPMQQFLLTAPILLPFKFASIVPLTHEMVQGSNAEAIMRVALAESTAAGLDAALFSNTAGVPGVRPPGLRYGIAAMPVSGGQQKSDAMQEDIIALVSRILPKTASAASNEDLRHGYFLIAAPPQTAALQFRLMRNVPFALASSALPDRTVIAVSVQALVMAVGTPRFDASTESVIHEEDTTPLPIVDSSGAAAGPSRSLWQTDSFGLRMRMPLSWALRVPDGVAWMQNVNW